MIGSHAATGWNITVEGTVVCVRCQNATVKEADSARTQAIGNVLQLLLKRCVVEFLANGKLTVDAFLGDVEVLDVEEAILANGLDEGLCELFLAFGSVVEAEIDGDEVRPLEISLRLHGESVKIRRWWTRRRRRRALVSCT